MWDMSLYIKNKYPKQLESLELRHPYIVQNQPRWPMWQQSNLRHWQQSNQKEAHPTTWRSTTDTATPQAGTPQWQLDLKMLNHRGWVWVSRITMLQNNLRATTSYIYVLRATASIVNIEYKKKQTIGYVTLWYHHASSHRRQVALGSQTQPGLPILPSQTIYQN